MKRTLLILLTLTLLVLGAQVALALPELPAESFQASSGCGCHAALLEQWRPSMHAQAITDPLYLYKLEQAGAATDGALDAFCETCHAPIAVMSGALPDGDIATLTGAMAEGVTCDLCHQVVGTDGPIGNASILFEADGVKKAQFDDAVSPGHATKYSAIHESAEFCGNCHNVDHPLNGMHLEATYTEWKEGPYAAEGIICQDCHMTPGPGVTKPNPGKAAGMGPEREHIYTMTFAGGNTALGDAVLAEERLQAAATLDLDVADIATLGDTVTVSTTITNVGAGHYLPTGLTEVRQMWLEVIATSADGTEVLSERHDFGTILKDEAGNYPVELWDAAGIQSDDRIPPKESVTDEYSFTMPEGAVNVSAALYYRSVSEEMAEGAGVDVPTTTMVSASADVYTSEAEKAEAVDAGDEPADDTEEADVPAWMIGGIVALVVAVAALLIWRARSQA